MSKNNHRSQIISIPVAAYGSVLKAALSTDWRYKCCRQNPELWVLALPLPPPCPYMNMQCRVSALYLGRSDEGTGPYIMILNITQQHRVHNTQCLVLARTLYVFVIAGSSKEEALLKWEPWLFQNCLGRQVRLSALGDGRWLLSMSAVEGELVVITGRGHCGF